MTPAPRRELRVDSADGTRLHVEVHGRDDGPTVVLSHGWTCSIPFWAPLVATLGSNYRVVLYDQRGHGRSAAPATTGYSTTALADDLCAVLEATVPTGEKAILGGHSMGGMTIMAAAQRPQVRGRAAAILLASTGSADLLARSHLLPGTQRFPRLRTAGHRFLLSSPLPLGPITPLTRAGLRYMTMAPDTNPRMVDFCTRLIHDCPSTTRARWGAVLADLDLEHGARELDLPTVIVHGTADRLTPIAHAHRLADLLPHCDELVELPATGHMTPLESPRHVAAVLTDLVAAHLAIERPKATLG